MEVTGADRLVCVRHRLRRASCRACAEACPVGCLDLTRGLYIDARACTDCGLCAAACPVQALPGATRDVPEAVERLSTVRQAILGCRSFSEGISTVRVSCLGGLTALDLLVLATAVQADELRLNLASCRLCRAGAAVVPVVRRRVDEAVGVLGSNKITTLADTRDAGVTLHQAMRRGFFKDILAPFAEVAYRVSSSERRQAESAPPLVGIPERQNHVLAQHGELPESSTTWQLKKTPHCDDCCRCVGVCPTGALTRQRSDGRRVFGIATERCTGCHACLDFCPKEGLKLSSRSPVRSGESETNARAGHFMD